MIYTLEKKTQRERLNERLRSSIDSTQFRIRNVTFFFKFTIFSTAKSHFFVNIFKKLIHVFIFFSNFFALNRWFKDFSATFFLSTVFIFSETFLLSTAGFQIFQQLFYFQPLVLRFFSNFFAFNRFHIFQKLFCFQPLVLRFFSNFFTFKRWFKDFSATFLLSTTGLLSNWITVFNVKRFLTTIGFKYGKCTL